MSLKLLSEGVHHCDLPWNTMGMPWASVGQVYQCDCGTYWLIESLGLNNHYPSWKRTKERRALKLIAEASGLKMLRAKELPRFDFYSTDDNFIANVRQHPGEERL